MTVLRQPSIRQPVSLLANVLYTIYAFALRSLITYRLNRYRRQHPEHFAPFKPSLTKSYPDLPTLTHRIFVPPNHAPSQTHPVFILIHGGGWVFGDPSMDDEQAALLSRKGYLVVSADYSLAPRHRFPTAIHEIEKTIHAVLADSSLPLDANGPLVVGGFSAGAVMSLSLAQLPSLRDRITAVVAFQPLTDWTREHRGPLRTTAWGEKDVLTYTQGLFAWAYIPAGQDMRDPLLSVLYADRTTLKAPVFIITSEMDCIADEAVVMAARLAGRTTERLDYTQGWEEGGVRYKCVRDMPHSFEHFWVVPKGEEWVGRRKEAIRDVWEQVTGWLDGVVEGTR